MSPAWSWLFALFILGGGTWLVHFLLKSGRRDDSLPLLDPPSNVRVLEDRYGSVKQLPRLCDCAGCSLAVQTLTDRLNNNVGELR